MKILVISQRIPSENKNGDQKIAFNRLSFMSKLGYRIELVCFRSKKKIEDEESKKILEKKGINVHFVSLNIFEVFLNLTLALFNNKLPFQCALFKSKKFSKKTKAIFENLKIDAIYCVMIRVSANIDWYSGKLFVEMVDSMGLNFLRRVQTSIGIKKLFFKIEQKRASVFEKFLANKSSCSFVVSSIDKKKIDSLKVKTAPLGVNIIEKERKITEEQTIIFSGNMFYQPNIHAVSWFIKNCWKDILIKLPKAKLKIVGSRPASSIVSISKIYPSIEVTGRVPSIFDFLCKAKVSIAPMWSGSGMQIKILEAMACSVPVVCTSIGIGDIKATPGKDLLVADTVDDFTRKVIYMLQSISKNKEIGKNGQEYVKKFHNWEILNKKFINEWN